MTEIGRIAAHKTTHQLNGPDEIDITGLAGAHQYVDRGSRGQWDFRIATFTEVDTWADLDLSRIVPAGAIAIRFRIVINSSTQAVIVQFKKKTYSGSKNVAAAVILFTGQDHLAELICACDTDRIIHYRQDEAMEVLDFLVLGWFT